MEVVPPPVPAVVVTALPGTIGIQGSTAAGSPTSAVLIADDKACRGAWGK